jgi:large subunit ribosomal protein L29
MKIEAYRDLTKDELLQKREEMKQELFNLRLRRSIRDLDNPLKLRVLKRELARVETVLNEDRKGIRRIVDQSGSVLDVGKGGDKKKSSEEK